MKAECLTCNQPGNGTYHVWDLSNSKAPAPPAAPDHILSIFTEHFHLALLDNDMEDIQGLIKQCSLCVSTCLDYLKYDRTDLINPVKATHKLTAPQTQPPPAPAAQSLPHLTNPQTVSMKLPKAEPQKWSGLRYEFYPWILSCSKLFDRTNCDNAAMTQLMLQVMPMEFKNKLICDFGNTEFSEGKLLSSLTN